MNKQSANEFVKSLVVDLESGVIHIEDIRPELTSLFRYMNKENPTKSTFQEDMESPKVLITMNGGLVQRIVGNERARNAGVRVIVADYDVEGVHPESLMLDADGDELTYVEDDLDEKPCGIETSLLIGEVTSANDDDEDDEGESV